MAQAAFALNDHGLNLLREREAEIHGREVPAAAAAVRAVRPAAGNEPAVSRGPSEDVRLSSTPQDGKETEMTAPSDTRARHSSTRLKPIALACER
jgi:hypothetical protein